MSDNENKRSNYGNNQDNQDYNDRGDRNDRNDRNDRRPYDNKDDRSQKRRLYLRKKVCRFCTDKNIKIDYKEVDMLRRFTTEGGKIIPRRITGNCAKHQRIIALTIRQARAIALLPYKKK
jgi:small subunit ribosomal protein S18